MRPELDHLSDDDLAVGNTEPVDAVDLLAAQGEEVDELLSREVEIEVFV
jgi:hypothetical protein